MIRYLKVYLLFLYQLADVRAIYYHLKSDKIIRALVKELPKIV